MPELPEIWNLARQMDEALHGKVISVVETRQPKCLNLPPEEFREILEGKTLVGSRARGKWVHTVLEPEGHFLLSLGMGGSLLYHPASTNLPVKYQLRLGFSDGSALTVGFWWFGYTHAVRNSAGHSMTATLGLDPLSAEFTPERFSALLAGKKGAIKTVLLDQHAIAGIGNVYAQDILFAAGLHPNRKVPQITPEEERKLFCAIGANLRQAAELGGLAYEKDLYDQPGRFKDFLVGYREGQPCPACGTSIVKIRTGATSTFICPRCQT